MKLQNRFINIWSILAQRYGKEEMIVFELLNEVVESENSEPWNDLASRTIKVIRQYAPKTQIIIGGIEWNSVRAVALLSEPYDENIIYTFHFYEPFAFTHQNASWVPETKNVIMEYPADVKEYRKAADIIGEKGSFIFKTDIKEIGLQMLEQLIEEAIVIAEKRGVALYCGEYGVIDQAPVESTLKWYQDMHEVFERNHIGRAAWSYKEMDFGIDGKHYETIRDGILASL